MKSARMAMRLNLNLICAQREASQPTCLQSELTQIPMSAPVSMCPAHLRLRMRTLSATILTTRGRNSARSPSWTSFQRKQSAANMNTCQYPIKCRLSTAEIKIACQSSRLSCSNLSPASIRRFLTQTARKTSSTMNLAPMSSLEPTKLSQEWSGTRNASPLGRSNVKRTNLPPKSTSSS